jgi:small subunit ribosomal protein S11
MGKKRIISDNKTDAQGADKASSDSAEKAKKQGGGKKNLIPARFYVAASYNNTRVSVVDSAGNLIAWSSAGAMGFKGPKKSTPYAASKVVDKIFEKLGGADAGKFSVSIYVQGIGSGRDAAVRAIAGRGLNITSLKDITPIPHNGCRPRKARRV